MTDKIILPAEVKVCATCSYWDGDRVVDPEVNLVVVSEACQGECLAQEKMMSSLTDVRSQCACIWESLEPDPPVESLVAATASSLVAGQGVQ